MYTLLSWNYWNCWCDDR